MTKSDIQEETTFICETLELIKYKDGISCKLIELCQRKVKELERYCLSSV